MFIRKMVSNVSMIMACVATVICFGFILLCDYDFKWLFKSLPLPLFITVVCAFISYIYGKPVKKHHKPNSKVNEVRKIIQKWLGEYAYTKDFFATYRIDEKSKTIHIKCSVPRTLKGCMDVNVHQYTELIEETVKSKYKINVVECIVGDYS